MKNFLLKKIRYFKANPIKSILIYGFVILLCFQMFSFVSNTIALNKKINSVNKEKTIRIKYYHIKILNKKENIKNNFNIFKK